MFCGRSMNSTTRPLFHDANSKRGGVLMHAKVTGFKNQNSKTETV
jgi:tyrosyl-DNA phosphodiesterase-1